MADALLATLVPILQRPSEVADRHRAMLHLQDWLGNAALGAQSEVGKKLAVLHQLQAAPGDCSVVATGTADVLAAVFFNATLGNILEMDDIHRTSILHPGPVVIPAALAMAQRLNASPDALLDAIIRGYEAVIRIGRSLGPTHYRYWHNTSTAGAFGAAAAACSLLELSTEQWVWALGNAGTRTGGLWQMRFEATDSKQLHNGWAAQTGVQAALAAMAGLAGPARLLEGEQGLFAATAAGGLPEWVCADAEAAWLIHSCSFKPWPSCRHTHPVIDAALKVKAKPQHITQIKIDTYQDAIRFCDKPHPDSELHAKFSLQHVVAVTLTKGAPALDDFSLASRQDPTYHALRQLTTVHADHTLSAAFPESYQARLTVQLQDGSIEQVLVEDVLGDPANPMSAKEISAKAALLLRTAGYSQEQLTFLLQGIAPASGCAALQHWLQRLSQAPAAGQVKD